MEKINGVSGYNLFIKSHGGQLKLSSVPVWFWHTLFKKLKNNIFDAGDSFIMEPLEDGVTVIMNRENGMLCNDSSHIYLVEHAWTFQIREAPLQLKCVEGLLPRMRAMLALLGNPIDSEAVDDDAVNEVYCKMWKHLRTYSAAFVAGEPPTPYWYIMDEFGSAIRHSNSPNFRAVPFLYQSESGTENDVYTLIFPIENLNCNDQVLIDFIEGFGKSDTKDRKALLVPWSKELFTDEPTDQFEPDEDYFMSGSEREVLPSSIINVMNSPVVMKVYSEYRLVNEYLKSDFFALTDDEEEADILWYRRHFYNYQELAESRPNTYINQFPCERVITTKDLLSIVARRAGKSPKWLPTTYNLLTELPAFVSYFQRRDAAGLDNHWICKPWNLARALDTTVTKNLDCILRLPFSGPKIAQKYAESPVLFSRPDVGKVKFDVRYVVLLKSVEPLQLFCYKKFFLRFANKPFQLDDLWNYEKHFTVMNYRNDSSLYRMLCDDFITAFHEQYENHPWPAVEQKLLAALKEVFVAASSEGSPRGMPHSPQSRALYAADFMLGWEDNEIQPLLLEINFTPDCERACQYYPDFYNDIFQLLFKNNEDSNKFHIL